MAIIQKAWGSYETVTVGELRALLADQSIPDEAELTIFPKHSMEDFKHVKNVHYAAPTGISGHELIIQAGEDFGY